MKVAIYSRFSTTSQDTTSIAGQIINCEALAARESLKVVARYQDEAASGHVDMRPQYQDMLKRLEAGEIDGVLADETSRITRNQAELHRFVAELRFRDQFLLTGDGVDTRSEGAEILLSVKAAMDAMESRKVAHRTYRSLRERHRAGHCAGGHIFGYLTEQDGKYRKRVINPETAEVVREIYERYAAGESAKTIARHLNEQGVPSPSAHWKTPRTKGWGHTTILGSKAQASGILRNPIYKGTTVWNKRRNKWKPGTKQRVQPLRDQGEWIESHDESLRIVSDQLWDRVQRRLDATAPNNRGTYEPGRPPKYLLSGLLKCACCGSSYTVRNGRAYTCSSQSNGKDIFCDQKTYLRKDVIETELLGGIKAQLLDPEVVKDMARKIRKQSRQTTDTTAMRKKAQTELAKVETQIGNVVESLAAVGQSDALTAKLRDLEARKVRLTTELSQDRQESTALPFSPGADSIWKEVVSDLENLRDRTEPDEIETARGLLREIIGEVEIREETGGIFAYAGVNIAAGYKSGAQGET